VESKLFKLSLSCIGMKLAQNATSVILAHIRRFRIEGDVTDEGWFDGTYGPGRLDRIQFIPRAAS
jgi:hypothetical protein